MIQLFNTCVIVFGFLTGLTALLLALPNFKLREVVYRVAEWIARRTGDSA